MIRSEAEPDHGRVYEVEAAAFGRSSEAELVELLRPQADPQLSLVAEERGRIVGHIFFSPVQIESARASPGVAGLAPVAVDPEHQAQGVGSALIRAGLEACPGLGWHAVFLVGDPGYYSRFGFALASPLGFSYGSPVMDAALQLLELTPGVLRGCTGRVRYHPAFEQTGF